MENITLHGHFDGSQIRLDDPYELEPNTKLLITIVDPNETEANLWHRLSNQGLSLAYGEGEPEYSINQLKEPNTEYERG